MPWQPGSCSSPRFLTMLLLSLLTALRVCLSMRKGAVQRPRKPGLSLSYTSLQSQTHKSRETET